VLACVITVFAAGSADRLFFQFGLGYEGAIWFFRGAFFVVPVLAYALDARRIWMRPTGGASHPLREGDGQLVSRTG
jgi:hypothetical protein